MWFYWYTQNHILNTLNPCCETRRLAVWLKAQASIASYEFVGKSLHSVGKCLYSAGESPSHCGESQSPPLLHLLLFPNTTEWLDHFSLRVTASILRVTASILRVSASILRVSHSPTAGKSLSTSPPFVGVFKSPPMECPSLWSALLLLEACKQGSLCSCT